LGIYKSWYPSGNLRWEKTPCYDYKTCYKSLLNTNNKSWYPDGKILSETKQIDTDLVAITTYFPNGNPCKKTYYSLSQLQIDGQINQGHDVYYSNGQLDYSERVWKLYKDYKAYYRNGKVRYYSEVHMGCFASFGKVISYYENGNIKFKGHFADYDEKCPIAGLQVGKWKFFDETGKLKKIEVCDKNGEIIKTMEK
jgi:antitoxin component YwqK of YwqJK toxin-antitoxin module